MKVLHETSDALGRLHFATIFRTIDTLKELRARNGRLFIIGNGGGAGHASHAAADFRKIARIETYAWGENVSDLTAYTNDIDFDGVFERQVQAHGRKGDVLLGISTSGNSKNVIRAVHAAKAIGMTSLALVGEGGQLASLASLAIRVPSKDTQRIQEAHLVIEHLLCELVENTLYRS